MATLKVKNNGVWELVSGGGSGGNSGIQIQSDYTQNDSSAMDYIKNRPCYVEEDKVLFDQTITTQLDSDGMFNSYNYDSPIYNASTERVGDVVSITVDDTVYECELKTSNALGSTLYAYGNKIIFLEGLANLTGYTIEEIINMEPEFAEFNEDSGEPFLIVVDYNGAMLITRQAGTYHYKIQADLYHMLDVNLMPEVDALPQVTTDNNGQTLAVVNGEWAVTAAASGLPAVTAADNDKVLMVVDGIWVAGSIANGDEVYY